MSVNLSKLASKRKMSFTELNGKIVAIDAYNVLYQFLSIIRQPDGTPLMDSHGAVTSHLSGLFYRTIELIGYGIKPVFVFDGIPSMLKQRTIEARMRRRREAYAAWQQSKESGDLGAARTHAQASTRINKDIVESAKQLLDLMGVPHINAPSEGEAQASIMCKEGAVFAAASQDYDTLLFGSPMVVRNLTFSGRRKLPRKNVYVNVEPELISLEDTLSSLGVSHSQLVWIGMLLGTDFNDGVKGVGPKTAVKLVKEASSIDELEKKLELKFKFKFEVDPRKVEALFNDPEVKHLSADEVSGMLDGQCDSEGIVNFMCKKHDFAEDRVRKFADQLSKQSDRRRQKGIENWF